MVSFLVFMLFLTCSAFSLTNSLDSSALPITVSAAFWAVPLAWLHASCAVCFAFSDTSCAVADTLLAMSLAVCETWNHTMNRQYYKFPEKFVVNYMLRSRVSLVFTFSAAFLVSLTSAAASCCELACDHEPN